MKSRIIVETFLTLLLTAACSKDNNSSGSVDSNIVGNWASTSTSEGLIVAPDGVVASTICGSFKIISTTTNSQASCQSGFPSPTVVLSCGSGKMSVTGSTNATGCQANGDHTCIYYVYSAYGDTTLSFNCGSGSLFYKKL